MEQINPNIQLNPITLATAIYNFFIHGETVYAYRVVQVIVSISLYVLAYNLIVIIYKHLTSGGSLSCITQGKTLDGGKCGEPITLFVCALVYLQALSIAAYIPVIAIVSSWLFRFFFNLLVVGARSLASQKTKSLHGTRGRDSSIEYSRQQEYSESSRHKD